MDLIDFHSESDRGCRYFATAQISHRAQNAGIIVAPSLEQTEIQYTEKGAIFRRYLTVPEHVFRDEIFTITEGERGKLISTFLTLSPSYKAIGCLIEWKDAFVVHYHNPVFVQTGSRTLGINPTNNKRIIVSQDENLQLEDLFLITKIEPPKKTSKETQLLLPQISVVCYPIIIS